MADHAGARIEHLKLIQNVITRMAGASADIKRFGLAFLAAALAFSASAERPVIVLLAAGLAAVFWVLDARYLQQERWFRRLYDEVRRESGETPADFRLTPDPGLRASETLLGAARSWATAGLYLPVIVILLIIWVLSVWGMHE